MLILQVSTSVNDSCGSAIEPRDFYMLNKDFAYRAKSFLVILSSFLWGRAASLYTTDMHWRRTSLNPGFTNPSVPLQG